MSDNMTTLEKVVSTTNVGSGGGGILNAEQSDRFIDYMWDESTLMKEVRMVRMVSDTVEIDKTGVGRRLARKATEGVDTGENAAVTFTKISITTTKIRLDWELTTEALEDNIEGMGLADHVAYLMATQFGNDLEDLAINGDTTSADGLLKSFDGFRKISKNGAGSTWVAAETPTDGLTLGVFNKAIQSLPRKYLARKSSLRFYTSARLVQDFLVSNGLQGRQTPIGDEIIYDSAGRAVQGAGGLLNLRPYGIPVVEVPLMGDGFATNGNDGDVNGSPSFGYVELTAPTNRIVGIKREVKITREYVAKKDTWEFTAFVRIGVQMDNLENYVGVYDVQALES
jgi:hypothetical protein